MILIGSGFDSRAYRLNGGRWIELDEPQIISYKNERLPIENCKNKLQRIAIDFETEALADKLQEFSTDQPVIVVMEGVFIYLPEEVIKQTLQTLHKLFPDHTLACDLMTEYFYKKYSHTLGQKIGVLGINFMFTSQKPTEVFCKCDYQLVEKHSIIGKAFEYGSIKVPKFIFKIFLKTLENGYTICIFESGFQKPEIS
ncbi:MAG: class I SAM-dependent methyltransferase [Methylobacter sp.]